MSFEENTRKLRSLILRDLLKHIEESDSLAAALLNEAERLSSDPDETMELVKTAQDEVEQKLKILLGSRPRPSKQK